MGAVFSTYLRSLYARWMRFRHRKSKILILGIDAAGKTTLLYQLKLGESVRTIATVGFNVETFEHHNISFTAWDVGGSAGLRPLWRHYFQETDAVVFVVDSADRERMNEAKEALHGILNDSTLVNAKLLVYANKQDLPNAMTPQEVTQELELDELMKRRAERGSNGSSIVYHVQPAVATKGTGLVEGLDWIYEALLGVKVEEDEDELKVK
ncbi:hypothetical protein Poli38472_004975 [Pythium oligandrum]|uniref:ADP-ribosylation factor n=1 Tax=Pythium oligandrum TaxID=41045 RepID=A0A8K1CBH6_PYTOL|nr:hypothetical protein Poli38472_004975 [Pythium oligandrum]|eukprot:TMW59906.1 hypothetical protein Poli38472_004975 [Pythium oligandrum]